MIALCIICYQILFMRCGYKMQHTGDFFQSWTCFYTAKTILVLPASIILTDSTIIRVSQIVIRTNQLTSVICQDMSGVRIVDLTIFLPTPPVEQLTINLGYFIERTSLSTTFPFNKDSISTAGMTRHVSHLEIILITENCYILSST